MKKNTILGNCEKLQQNFTYFMEDKEVDVIIFTGNGRNSEHSSTVKGAPLELFEFENSGSGCNSDPSS